jgi:fatty acid desaturase
MRASDSEREAVATQLRDHAAAGRLDPDELDERLTRALAARTREELVPLTADLPAPAERPRRRPPSIPPLVPIAVLLIAIWALTGMGYFWPMWPIGAMLLSGLKHGGATMHRRRVPAG